MTRTPTFAWPPPQQFIRLVGKARQSGIALRPLPHFTKLNVASSSTGKYAYFVDEFACSCQAGRFGRLCSHRALYIFTHMSRIIDEHGLPAWKVERDQAVAG